MLYTIIAVSPEEAYEDFAIELQIESDATFADLHQLIRKTCEWDSATPSKPATFYMCDGWRRERAIPEKSYEEDTMDEVELGDLIDDVNQRLMYVFDAEKDRGFLLEVTNIEYGKHIAAPRCRRSHGTSPAIIEEAPAAIAADAPSSLLAELNAAALAAEGLDDDDREPTDDDLFELDELDPEGFDFAEE